MRLGLSLYEAYLLIMAFLVVLAGIGTMYCHWAMRRVNSPQQVSRLRVLSSRIRFAWWLIVIFALAFWGGFYSLLVVFAFLSFYTFREFVALTPTKQADHWSLVVSFYIVIPLQYILIAFNQYAIFTLFIPVYFFLMLPILMTLGRDSDQYLGRVAKIQWGLMLSVYCISHAPAIMHFEVSRYGSSASFLLLFFVLVVFLHDLYVVMASSYLGGKPLKDNPTKTNKGVIVGSVLAVLTGYALFWITPFRSEQALISSVAIVFFGVMGDLVIASVKRSFSSRRSLAEDEYLTRGALERLAPMMFAAPIYYHLAQYIFFRTWI